MERAIRRNQVGLIGRRLLVGACAVALLWFALPHERLLTDIAHPLMRTDIEKEQLTWISDHQLLSISTQQETVAVRLPNSVRIDKNWQGSADLINTTSHARTHLDALTKLLIQKTALPAILPATGVTPSDPTVVRDIYALWDRPNEVQISPDGTWILWKDFYKDSAPSPSSSAYLDGTHYREWKHRRDSEEEYFADSGHVVQWQMPEGAGLVTDEYPIMIVRDLRDSTKDRIYPTRKLAQAALAPYAARKPMVLSTIDSFFDPAPKSVEIDGYRMQNRAQLFLYDRVRGMQVAERWMHHPDQIQFAKLPEGARVVDTGISPQQQSVFYDLQITRTHPFVARLNRALPMFALKPDRTEGFWVSRADGSGMHEIGHLPMELDRKGDPTFPFQERRWLPDGKRISFAYHGMLYTAPAFPEK